ncbi:hypothetical protein TRIUR3_30240 [Triticum urartu]|uniref:Uncharacterized protein n=1 Tax=Triticum urartu TaxID=4572 RepID=M8A556_TRIUA|nr:uncharacterized protein LOC125541577 [Triticum urartu]EMS67512.1 hypothetical protein TRIUR3_30240 [Triticum urartu]
MEPRNGGSKRILLVMLCHPSIIRTSHRGARRRDGKVGSPVQAASYGRARRRQGCNGYRTGASQQATTRATAMEGIRRLKAATVAARGRAGLKVAAEDNLRSQE